MTDETRLNPGDKLDGWEVVERYPGFSQHMAKTKWGSFVEVVVVKKSE